MPERRYYILKIGDISKICGVTVKTMRFYERRGLIAPIVVDRWTGYRYYDESSIARVSQIVYLKSIGFSLKEIKTFDRQTIENKTNEIKANIVKLQRSIKTLQSFLKCEKGEDIMKRAFINDGQVIGKWQKISVVDSIESYSSLSKNDKEIFPFEVLYCLPNGEKYWVVSWTKGNVLINEKEYPYVIKNNLMFIGVKDNQSGQIDKYAVYKQVNNTKYAPNDIKVEDNVDVPFVDDPEVVGFWNRVDLVKNIEQFNPKKRFAKANK